MATAWSRPSDGRSALRRWDTRRPDVVLLDLGLPDIDGVEVIQRIRREATTPIVILSGRYDEREKVDALERGADDYVTKPFGVDELNARLRVALRRSGGGSADPSGRLSVGTLTLDPSVHEVRVAGERVDLTPREFEILRVLLTPRRPHRDQGSPAARGVGRGVSRRGQLRLRPRQPAPPQARGRRQERRAARI